MASQKKKPEPQTTAADLPMPPEAAPEASPAGTEAVPPPEADRPPLPQGGSGTAPPKSKRPSRARAAAKPPAPVEAAAPSPTAELPLGLTEAVPLTRFRCSHPQVPPDDRYDVVEAASGPEAIERWQQLRGIRGFAQAPAPQADPAQE